MKPAELDALLAEAETDIADPGIGARELRDDMERLCAALREQMADANAIERAAAALLDSLGEYVRQSMHHNPEWCSGVRAVEDALHIRRRRLGRILASAPSPAEVSLREQVAAREAAEAAARHAREVADTALREQGRLNALAVELRATAADAGRESDAAEAEVARLRDVNVSLRVKIDKLRALLGPVQEAATLYRDVRGCGNDTTVGRATESVLTAALATVEKS